MKAVTAHLWPAGRTGRLGLRIARQVPAQDPQLARLTTSVQWRSGDCTASRICSAPVFRTLLARAYVKSHKAATSRTQKLNCRGSALRRLSGYKQGLHLRIAHAQRAGKSQHTKR